MITKEDMFEIQSRARLGMAVAQFVHDVDLSKYNLRQLVGLSECIEAVKADLILNPKEKL